MKTLLVLRGLPGSGKSTLANTLKAHSVNCREISLDLWISQHGYLQGEMKQWTEMMDQQIEEWMQNEVELIVVHGVFAQHWSYRRYLDMASEHLYEAFVCIVENFHDGRNENITESKIESMVSKFKVHLTPSHKGTLNVQRG